MFVCLFNRSVRADTRMGPEGTKLKQKPEPGLKSLYYSSIIYRQRLTNKAREVLLTKIIMVINSSPVICSMYARFINFCQMKLFHYV